MVRAFIEDDGQYLSATERVGRGSYFAPGRSVVAHHPTKVRGVDAVRIIVDIEIVDVG